MRPPRSTVTAGGLSILVSLIGACGRIGFDPAGDGASGDATAVVGDGASGDASAALDAVHFSTTAGNYLAGNQSGTTSARGLLSIWFRLTGGDSTAIDLFVGKVLGSTGGLTRTAGNHIQAQLYNCVAQTVIDVQTQATYTTASGWTHILASWDLAVPKLDFYVNDVSDLASPATVSSGNVCFGVVGNWGLGGIDSATFDGDIVEDYFAIGTYLDLSVVANRRLFRDAAGKPVDLGPSCTAPTGQQPFHCFFGAAATWPTNQGSGGVFTLHGSALAPVPGP